MRSLALTEPLQTSPTEEPKKFRYHGGSMRSTFTPGEVLYVKPKFSKIKPGDVVVYRKGDEYVVHRVNGVSAAGLRTRGDNNPREDENAVLPGQIVGIVEGVDTGVSIRPVTGGRCGLFKAKIRWRSTAFVNWLRPVIGYPYRWLKKKGIVNRFWHPDITILNVHTNTGLMVKYMLWGKVVATWQPEISRFTYRRPFDLVIFPPKNEK